MSFCHLQPLRSTSMNTTQNLFLSCGFWFQSPKFEIRLAYFINIFPELNLYSLKSWKLSFHSVVVRILACKPDKIKSKG